jgi:hypothetical protein
MKLRWIDSKSKRLHEVFIDLKAILKSDSFESPVPLSDRQRLASGQLAPVIHEVQNGPALPARPGNRGTS